MKTIKIPVHGEPLQKIIKAMKTIEKATDRANISLSYSELRYLKRLLLTDEAMLQLSYESLEDHISFSEKQKKGVLRNDDNC